MYMYIILVCLFFSSMKVNMKFVKNLAFFRSIYIFGLLLFTVNGRQIKVNVFYDGHWSSGQHMPDKINVNMTGSGIFASLHLSRVTRVNDDLPVFTISVDSSGQLNHTREVVDSLHSIAHYQDADYNAVFLVTCHDDERPQHKRQLQFNGQFYYDGSLYTLNTLTSSDKQQWSSRDPYVIQRENETKDLNNSYVRMMSRDGGPQRGQSFGQQSSLSIGEPSDSVKRGIEALQRRPRQAKSNYYIDIVAVVDYKAYTRFYQQTGNRSLAIGSIKEYYGFIMSGVDMMYQSINISDFRLHVRLIKIVVAETAESSNFTELFQVSDVPVHTVDDDLALTALMDYVNGPGHAVVTPSDHVMLFTGYDITRKTAGLVSKKAAGRAYKGTLCQTDGHSTSVIEDIKGFNCIGVAAHELGHSFSVDHDGDGNDCQSSDRYIMSIVTLPATPATKLNPWRFSSCSERQIAKFVSQLLNTRFGQECLTEMLPTEDSEHHSTQNLPGLKYSADEQCRMIYGNSSFLCPRIPPYDLFLDPSNICTEMYCYHPVERTCYNSVPAQGTACGSGKVCVSGECLNHSSAMTFNETCMFGDNPLEIINGLNCSQAITQFPFFCYESDIATSCCRSCQDIYKPVQGCEYGDHMTGCHPGHCHGNSIKFCCETCASQTEVTRKPSSVSGDGVCVKDNPKASINDGTCQETITSYPFFCYIKDVVAQCCESCRKMNTSVAGCEFGDHVSGCSESHCHEGSTSLQECCGTCKVGWSSGPAEALSSEETVATPQTTTTTAELPGSVSLSGRDTEPPGSVSLTGSDIEPTGSVSLTGSDIEPTGSVSLTGSDIEPTGSVSLTGSDIEPTGSVSLTGSDIEPTGSVSLTGSDIEPTGSVSLTGSDSETTVSATLSAITSDSTSDSKLTKIEPAVEDTNLKDYKVVTTFKDLNVLPSSSSETTSVDISTASLMLVSPAKTESNDALLQILRTTVNPSVATSVKHIGAISDDPSGITTVTSSEATTFNPSQVTINPPIVTTDHHPPGSSSLIATESGFNEEVLSAVKKNSLNDSHAAIHANVSTSQHVNIPTTSDVKTQSTLWETTPSASTSSSTSHYSSSENLKTTVIDPASQPSTPTQPPQLQLQQYVSRQQQQLQQHMLQQQFLLERLLQHDLLHQENTLLHHQLHLKQLLQHYLRHQRQLIEHHLAQQRALLQEHLRNQEILQKLCKN